ncbi:toxin YdaT family protein [Klebsiella oxytoca]|nr:hypothetical protein [Klebsiella oxytoca]
MKIIPSIDVIAPAIEAWALTEGWKAVASPVSDEYHATGGGPVLPLADSENGLNNAAQRVKRIFRNYNGPRYRPMADELIEPALRAMPAMRRAAVIAANDPGYLSASCLKEITEFLNAVNLGASTRELVKEGREAREALNKLYNSVIPAKEFIS